MIVEADVELQMDLLLSRLAWPSALVRERVAGELARLLNNGEFFEDILEKLLSWMAQQTLESICNLGLIVLCKAKNSYGTEFNATRVWNNVGRPSILAWNLIRELDEEFATDKSTSLFYTEEILPFTHHKFFNNNIATYIPGVYAFHARNIKNSTQMDFLELWENEWHALVNVEKPVMSQDSIRYWMGHSRENYSSADTLISEIYRSSYLRALARLVAKMRFPFDTASYLASIACPIDIGLWDIPPLTKPSRWPSLNADVQAIDTSIADLWEQVSSLWEARQALSVDNFAVAAVDGAINQGDVVYQLRITGLFQKAHGPQKPDLDRVADWCIDSREADHVQNSLFRFSGELTRTNKRCTQFFDDWSFVPVTATVSPTVVARWQPWRRRMPVPSKCLPINKLSFQCTPDAVTFFDGEHKVGSWADWTHGITERSHYDLPPDAGQILWIDQNLLDRYAKDHHAQFCWLCTITRYYLKKSYDEEYENFSDYRLFGATSLSRA